MTAEITLRSPLTRNRGPSSLTMSGCFVRACAVATPTWLEVVLARAVARHLGRPCTALLERGAGPAQTGRPLAERRAGPLLLARTAVTGHVLVVDDVITSGATCSAAARVLREAGATTISAIAAARTPPPSGRGAA